MWRQALSQNREGTGSLDKNTHPNCEAVLGIEAQDRGELEN